MNSAVDAFELALLFRRKGELSEAAALCVDVAAAAFVRKTPVFEIDELLQIAHAMRLSPLDQGALYAAESLRYHMLASDRVGLLPWVRKRHAREAEKFAARAVSLLVDSRVK